MTNKINDLLIQDKQSKEQNKNIAKTGETTPANKSQKYLTQFAELKPALYKKCEELLLEKMQGEILERYKSISKTIGYIGAGLGDDEAIQLLNEKAEIAIKHQSYYTAVVDCNRAVKMWTPPLSDYHEIKYGINGNLADVLRTRANVVQKFQALEDISKAIELKPFEEYYLFRAQLMNDFIGFPGYAKMDIRRAYNRGPFLRNMHGYNPKFLSRQIGTRYIRNNEYFQPNIKIPTGPNYSSAWEVTGSYKYLLNPIEEDIRLRAKYGADSCKNRRNASLFHFKAGEYWLMNESYSSDAIGDFNKCIEIEPDYHQAYWYRAIIRCANFDKDGAIMDLLTCFLLSPENTFDNYIYALAEGNKGNSKFFRLYRCAEDIFLSAPQDEFCTSHPEISVIRSMSTVDRKRYEDILVSLVERNSLSSCPVAEHMEIYELLVKYTCKSPYLLLFHLTTAVNNSKEIIPCDNIGISIHDEALSKRELLKNRIRTLTELNEPELAKEDLEVLIRKEKEICYYREVVMVARNFLDS